MKKRRSRKRRGMAKKLSLPSPPADLISRLPSDLLLSILSFLPLRDAARTTVLSKTWKPLFLSLPRLVFDDSIILRKHLHQDNNDDDERWLDSAEAVLRYRGGGGFFCKGGNGVKELVLDKRGLDPRVPPRLFTLCRHSLVKLELKNCLLSVPCDFYGLPCLKLLVLERVDVPDDHVIESFVLDCEALERLVVLSCSSISDLVVSSSSLLSLRIHATTPMDFSVKGASRLTDVDVGFFYDQVYVGYPPSLQYDEILGYRNCTVNYVKRKFFGFLGEISHVKSLRLRFSDKFAEAFTEMPERFPRDVLLNNLKNLNVEMDVANPKSLSLLFSLLQSCCQSLDVISIKVFECTNVSTPESEIPGYWESKSPLEHVMHRVMQDLGKDTTGIDAFKEYVSMAWLGRRLE